MSESQPSNSCYRSTAPLQTANTATILTTSVVSTLPTTGDDVAELLRVAVVLWLHLLCIRCSLLSFPGRGWVRGIV